MVGMDNEDGLFSTEMRFSIIICTKKLIIRIEYLHEKLHGMKRHK
jgi:hypothetical protein